MAKESAIRRKAIAPDWIEIQYPDGMFRSVYGSRVAIRWHEAIRHRSRRKVV
jgi:hypothetical protein